MSRKVDLMTNRKKKKAKELKFHVQLTSSKVSLIWEDNGKLTSNKKAGDEYFRMVFSYFRAWSFILALYMIKGQKVKKNVCIFLLSTSQGDYNTNLARL